MLTPLLVLVRGLSSDPGLTGPAALAAVHLDDDVLIITPEAPAHGATRPFALPVKELAGIAILTRGGADDAFVLYPLRGAALALQPRAGAAWEDVLAIARRMERRAFALPELTRGLRAVGTRRGAPGDDHDHWFGGLLAARLQAARAGGWSEQLAAFEPDSLRRQFADAVTAMATARYPDSQPDQRALAAALEEHTFSLHGALDVLAGAERVMLAAGDEERLVAWRAWVGATRQCFVAADRGWLAMTPLLARHAPAAPAGAAAHHARVDTSGRKKGWWRVGNQGGHAT